MSHLPLTEFRSKLYDYWKLVRDSSAVFEVTHHRRIYRVSIEDTGRYIQTPYRNKGIRKSVVPTAMVDTMPCSSCDSLMISGVCMNATCPTNRH